MTITPGLCKSVFCDGSTEPTTERITELWVALIDQLEKTGAPSISA